MVLPTEVLGATSNSQRDELLVNGADKAEYGAENTQDEKNLPKSMVLILLFCQLFLPKGLTAYSHLIYLDS
jgi:hypothetical protein